MSEHLLLLAKNLEPYLSMLPENFEIHRWYNSDRQEQLLAKVGSQIRYLATNGHIGCSAEMMDKLPNLEMIGCFGVGYDAIDLEAAKQRNIQVSNTPDVLNDAVAELALGLVIALSRQIPQSDQYIRLGQWQKGAYPLTSELTGKTAGIVGLGRIGKEVARRLQAMKMRVVYHGRRVQTFEPYEYYVDLVQMAQNVDWLIICLPGQEGDAPVVTKEVIAALDEDSHVVNVARGSVIDEDALCQAIAQQKIAGAALDVFADEPNIPQVLLDADNVILSPHAASATKKSRHSMGELVIKNIIAHVEGRHLMTRVI